MKRGVGKDRLGKKNSASRSTQFDNNLQCKKKKKKTMKEIVGKSNKYKPLNYDKGLHYDFMPR